MELKEFVRETLNQIIDGVKEAQEYAKEAGATVNPDAGQIQKNQETVEFDIAVSSSGSEQTGGGLSVRIASIGAEGGKDKGSEDTRENRVRFSVRVLLPRQS